MSSLSSRIRPFAVALAIPVGGIAISYSLLIDGPLRSKISDAQAKVTRLTESVAQRSAEHDANLRTLAQIKQSQRDLNKLVTTATVDPLESTKTPDSVDAPVITTDKLTNSPLTQLSATIALFARHHVPCLASQYAAELNVGSKPPVEHSTVSMDEDRELRITLEGTFGDMHRALADLQLTMNSVAILSLEMEASSPGSNIHRWIIVLRV